MHYKVLLTEYQIISTLKHSLNYIEFMINLNEITDSICAIHDSNLKSWKRINKIIRSLKKTFRDNYDKEYGIITRQAHELLYVYDVSEKEVRKILEDVNSALNVKIKYYKRIESLTNK